MVTDTGDRDDLGIGGLGPGVRLGTGGSAVVNRARQDELDRDVAVKILAGVIDDDSRRRFDRERRLMGRMSEHEGMVTVHQTGFTDRGEPYIVMPVRGHSLDDEVKDQPLGWERATEIMADVSRTVAHAHDQGVVHRDIKPGNIMLSTSGRPLVADFGIARIVDSKTNLEATALTLTPAYSPPEALETTVAHPTSDVYSLGATLYALIAGHPPYCAPGEDRTLMALMRSIFDEPVPQLGAAAPPTVQQVIDRAMAKAPEARYQSATELADALDAAVAAAQPPPAAETQNPPPPAPPAALASSGDDSGGSGSKRPLILAGVAVVAILALIAGVLFATSGGDETAAPADSAVTEAEGAGSSGDADTETDNGDTVAGATDADTEADTAPPTTEAVLVVEGGEVFLLPFDEPGERVFTRAAATPPDDALIAFASVGGNAETDDAPPSDDAGDADPTPTVTGVSGTDDGVFAGTAGVAPCQPAQLVEALTPDAAETIAWADVLALEVADIAEFVDGLTAVVLTDDVRITDHEFVDGEAMPRQVVLQVGTAVLVDEFGEPQVRCLSGSPLTTPEPVEGTTRYVGGGWDTFEPNDTAAVLPAPEPVEEFVLTDVAGGDDFIRPVGSSGASDWPLLPGEILATGGLTSFPTADIASFTLNEINMIFRPEGGDVTGDFMWSVTSQGVSFTSTGDFTGSFDPATNTMSGSATAPIEAGGGVVTHTATAR